MDLEPSFVCFLQILLHDRKEQREAFLDQLKGCCALGFSEEITVGSDRILHVVFLVIVYCALLAESTRLILFLLLLNTGSSRLRYVFHRQSSIGWRLAAHDYTSLVRDH